MLTAFERRQILWYFLYLCWYRLKFLLTVFAGLSELERNIINERTEEGCASAKKRGVEFGRKFKLTPHQRDQVRTMLKDGQSIRAIARHFIASSGQ